MKLYFKIYRLATLGLINFFIYYYNEKIFEESLAPMRLINSDTLPELINNPYLIKN